jgi:hypothetical protein
MVLLDTNVFIIDRFFTRDERYAANQEFIAQLSSIEAGFSIFSLFELCGIASFNLSPQEHKRWMYHLNQVYNVVILEPQGLYTQLAAEWFKQFSQGLFQLFEFKMTWGDAALLHCANEFEADAIITWNKKHFEGRTTIKIMTPGEYN